MTTAPSDVEWLDFDGGLWLLNTHELATHAASNPDLFSSDQDVDGTRRHYERDGVSYPYRGTGVPAFPGRLGLVSMDTAEHRPYRRLLTPLLSPKEVARLEPRIREIVTESIDGFIEDGRCDVMSDLATPVPALVTIEGLGLSPEQARPYASVMHTISSGVPGPERDEAEVALGQMLAEVAVVAAERRADPKDDWLSALATAEIDGKPMSDSLLLENALIVIAGGVETTTTLLANTMLYLQEHPEARDQLLADRELIPVAFEEFLRAFTPVKMIARTVTQPVTLGGVDLREGDRVVLNLGAANRDSAVFDSPDEVQFGRSGNRHLAFGSGIHRCAGAALGQLEFRVVLEEVLERLPDLEIDLDAVELHENPSVRSFLSIPATFSPRARQSAQPRDVD